MKRTSKLHKIGADLLLSVGLAIAASSCSDQFLQDKSPYGNFGPDLVYNDWTSVNLRLNYLYEMSLPYYKGTKEANEVNRDPDFWPIGLPDNLSMNTDEFTGYGDYTNPTQIWDNNNIKKYFYYSQNDNPWKKIRECNDVITRVEESPTLTEKEKSLAIAQARFFRATRYYRMWKRYGGVPIVKTLQGTVVKDSLEQRVQRESTDDTYKFMIEDLMYVSNKLPARWEADATDWGRITAGTGLALAGIIANYYASPVFNRNDDEARWKEAYEINTKAIQKLDEGKFGLAYEGDPGVNASNWAKIWSNGSDNTCSDGNVSEAVYLAICNTVSADDRDLYNCWEQMVRPSNSKGSSSLIPTAEMVDAFPMADGKRPGEAGTYRYDKTLFFLNRDPRFYRTFAFPGVEWKFQGNIEVDDPNNNRNYPYTDGNQYALYSIAWYQNQGKVDEITKSGRYTDFLGNSGQGSVYVRKKSQDLTVSSNPYYKFSTEDGFKINGQPAVFIRYTEVLLNLAEAACGINKLDEAWDILVRIRQRIGYTGDCGLDPAIKTDRAKMFEAILYERKIELAYEGKRFDDCHRWMLFDGGVGQESIEPNWKLTGWNGNTCTYLGVKPLIEVPLHRLEMYLDPSVWAQKQEDKFDPFYPTQSGLTPLTKPKALTLKENMTATAVEGEDGISYNYKNATVQQLAEFYGQKLKRKDIPTMNEVGETTGAQISWQPNLYLMGLNSGDQANNPNVVQTIGWNSYYGGMGVFDPLSLTPNTGIDNESKEPETPAE